MREILVIVVGRNESDTSLVIVVRRNKILVIVGPSDENRQRIKLRITLNNPESYKFYKILFDLKQIKQITFFNNRTNRK